jgi:hypothetical protein
MGSSKRLAGRTLEVEVQRPRADRRDLLSTLSRLPTAAERANFEAELPSGADSATREEVFPDLFWALLNTKEFAFQH